MELESKAYPGVTEPPRPTIAAHADARVDVPTDAHPAKPTPKPKPKRYRKTIDQQVAEAEERLKDLKERQRKARTHRLSDTGGIIESVTGIQFTEKADRERLKKVLTKTRKRHDGSTYTWADSIAQAYNNIKASEDEQ